MSAPDMAELIGNIIALAIIAASMGGAWLTDKAIRNRDRIRRARHALRRILRDGEATPRTIRSRRNAW